MFDSPVADSRIAARTLPGGQACCRARDATAGAWLIVNERRWSGWGWRAAARGERAAQQARIPASVQRHIERGARYQSLLARMLELSGQLQGTLSDEQRALWLRLEDVLFDYAQLMAEAHYEAGRHDGARETKGE